MSAISKRLSAVSLLIIVAFFPSLFAELSSVDDADMYRWIANSETSLKDLFFPQASGGGYYRPLIGVSYLFDKYVWFLDTRLMHLDNLFFHLTNALLVYYLAYLLLPQDKQSSSMLPLASSLLFGIHPLTVESVAWISGRTDIMAGTFVLLSTLFLLRFLDVGKKSNLVLALAVLIPGLLIKETPLAFLLAALFILSTQSGNSIVPSPASSASNGEILRCALSAVVAAFLLIISYSVWPVFLCGLLYLCYEVFKDRSAGKPFQIRTFLLIITGTALPIGLFLLIRRMVFTSNISSIGRTMNLIVDDLNYAFQTFLGAAGFYVRKFFLPFPLNFAIREIDPLYNAAGVAVFFFCLYAIRRKSMSTALFLTGVCLFLPALPLSLGTITWTAYAERYVYMSTAYWSLAVCLWVGRSVDGQGYKRAATVCITLLLIVIAVCTFQRNITWKSNLTLLHDTVQKSPGFKSIRADYMTALMGSGDLEGAKAQYRIAQKIPSVGYMESLDINMAALYAREGRNEDAEKLYKEVLKKTMGKSGVAYGAYISYLQERYVAARQNNDGSESVVGVELVENMEKLYGLNKDPFLLYRSGQLSLALGRCDDALRLFTQAEKAFPKQSEYTRISARLADNLAARGCRQERL